MKTMILVGSFIEDGKLRLHIPFTQDLTLHPSSRATGDNVVEVDLLDKNDVVLHQASLDAMPVCVEPINLDSSPVHCRQVSGVVAMPDGTAGLRLRWRGRVIHEARAPAGSPSVWFTWKPPENGVVSGPQKITWEVSHPDCVPLHVLVLTEGRDGTRQMVASLRADVGELAAASQVVLNADYFSQGTVALVIIVSDGFHQTSDTSEHFAVVSNR